VEGNSSHATERAQRQLLACAAQPYQTISAGVVPTAVKSDVGCSIQADAALEFWII